MKKTKKTPAIAADKSAAAEAKPTPTDKELTLSQMFWRAGLLSLAFATLMLLLTALVLSLWGYGKFKQFLATAQVSKQDFIQEIETGWQSTPAQTEQQQNILVLGTDSTPERGEVPPLTDTMMLVSIDLRHGVINTLSLPRDLWSEDYQTKINALLAYGSKRYPDHPEQFPAEVVEQMTGVPIHHTLVLSLEQMHTLIDLIGGVTVNVEESFTDPLFPRSGVDITTVTDPALLYETVSFAAGEQTLSGERAMQYIRSRHSEDEQGHDLARGARQQQIIEAIIKKLTNPWLFIKEPQVAGNLYHFYQQNFAQYYPLTELIGTTRALLPNRQNLAFQRHELTEIDKDPASGVLDNPPRLRQYQYQWVYIIDDQAKFQQTIKSAFSTEN